jgi:transposase
LKVVTKRLPLLCRFSDAGNRGSIHTRGRPASEKRQGTASTYIFGAVCPKDGKGAALILPACNTEAMNLHLVEIAKTVTPGAHAVLLVDQAGWHLSTRLVVPPNITIIALPPKCPELNLVENIWQFLHDNWLSNRVFKSYDDLVDHCLGSRFRDSLTMSSFRTIPCLFLHVEQQRILRLLGSGRIVR